jgi:large subunit ribosomal protein L15
MRRWSLVGLWLPLHEESLKHVFSFHNAIKTQFLFLLLQLYFLGDVFVLCLKNLYEPSFCFYYALPDHIQRYRMWFTLFHCSCPVLPMLHTIKPAKGSRRKIRRLGRGNSAGGGTTAGRGTKGQHARTGKGQKFGFEGGQVPLLMRQPKMGGFVRPRRENFEPVNIGSMEEKLDAGSYGVADLRARHLVRGKGRVKLLGTGKLTKKFTITVHAASKSALEAVKKAGGTVTFLQD